MYRIVYLLLTWTDDPWDIEVAGVFSSLDNIVRQYDAMAMVKYGTAVYHEIVIDSFGMTLHYKIPPKEQEDTLIGNVIKVEVDTIFGRDYTKELEHG